MTEPERQQQVPVPWSSGRWTHEPVGVRVDEGDGGTALVVEAAEGSDAWRTTSYGFIHESEHALVAPFPVGCAMDVVFTADLPEQFDQAGLFVTADPAHWVKAGVECSDGVLQLGAVVTAGMSDWSVAPVPEWGGRRVRLRVSRMSDALIVRAGAVGTPLRLVRVLPFFGEQDAQAGPMVCAPSRAGLSVCFESWTIGPTDASLHPGQ